MQTNYRIIEHNVLSRVRSHRQLLYTENKERHDARIDFTVKHVRGGSSQMKGREKLDGTFSL